VNAICPAAMPLTNFGVSGYNPDQAFQDKPAERLEMTAQFQPLGRYITGEDCAHAAAFLASDLARNITGVMLPIDGGLTAK
jgi:NAD(P)-dependent dehydrogenase (short-subunit alcohol dehydrogenase family)